MMILTTSDQMIERSKVKVCVKSVEFTRNIRLNASFLIEGDEGDEMKKGLVAVLMASVLSGCVTREIVRTVQVPVSAPVVVQGNNTVSTQRCELLIKIGNKPIEYAGRVTLLNRTDGNYIQTMNGTVVAVTSSKWSEEYKVMGYFVDNPNNGVYGMAYNCK